MYHRTRFLAVPFIAVLLLAGTAPFARAQGAHTHPQATTRATNNNLPYKGGIVMHHPTVYPIFWLPNGYHFHPASSAASDGDYENLVVQFLNDLSGTPFYSMLTQYYDKKGRISNGFETDDGVVDTTAFPNRKGTIANPLLNSDIKAEILKVIQRNSWDNVLGESEFIVYTPYDLQVCSDPSSNANSKQQCTYRAGAGGRCGYHTWFSSGGQRYLISVITDGRDRCHAWQRKLTDDTTPNSDVLADLAVDVTSHELFESVTDPFFDAWAASNDDENGDKCSDLIGPINDDGGDIYLNDDPYIIQKEWSNLKRGCTM